MAMSGTTGQVFQPLSGLQNRQQPMGMNTMAIFNNISRPLLIIVGGAVLTLAIMRWYKRRG
jgi:hypothetical protein